jgi:SNF2 family DNA or RNA helicase
LFKGTLLPYQPEAVDRMCDRKSMLVAYDLGLGKTVLTIAAIERLKEEQKVTEPGLIICLSPLKYQWYNQIRKFTDGTANPLVIDGTPKQRELQYLTCMRTDGKAPDYIILNYEQVVNDWKYVRNLPRGFVVLDEATAIKSFRSKRSKHVKELKSDYRFALTGTPIENGKPEELFSIMQFVDKQVLGKYDIFDSAFIVRNKWGGVDRYRNLPTLHQRMKQASVRKAQTDADVAPYLPEAIHKEPMTINIDSKGAKLYEKIKRDLLNDLADAQELFGSSFNIMAHYGLEQQWGGPADEMRGKLMSKIGAMKMLCSHPQLILDSAAKFHKQEGEGSAYCAELVDSGLLVGVRHPKLDAVVTYVKDFLNLDAKNKVVIFATHVHMVDLIVEALDTVSCVTYTGLHTAKAKEENKIAFNTEPDIRVLVSSDAGGYGVDLPAGNLLINYDLPWSSGTANQRNGRIVRASSEHKSVVILDAIISNSIEQRQYQALQQKNAIASAVLDGKGINEKGGVEMTLASLNTFLQTHNVY